MWCPTIFSRSALIDIQEPINDANMLVAKENDDLFLLKVCFPVPIWPVLLIKRLADQAEVGIYWKKLKKKVLRKKGRNHTIEQENKQV